MSETSRNESTSPNSKMPVQEDEVQFPPFPDPKDTDFDEDIPEPERTFYKNKFQDLNTIKTHRMHCTSCDRHLGCSASNDSRMRMHPMLRTLVCNTCYAFYNSGEFEKGDDGSELYCRWCGQGGQVYCCSDCPHVFCAKCIKRNLGVSKIREIENTDDWKCFKCSNKSLWELRASCWALHRYCDLKNRITMATQDPALKEKYQADCARDLSDCCRNKKRRDKLDSKKKEEKKDEKKEAEISAKKAAAAVISKIPPTIQVKKFASINLEEPKVEKKAAKRSLSPKQKLFLKNPISVAGAKNFIPYPPMPKKIRMSSKEKSVRELILQEFYKNPNLSTSELAQSCNTSRRTVQRTITKQGGIIKIKQHEGKPTSNRHKNLETKVCKLFEQNPSISSRYMTEKVGTSQNKRIVILLHTKRKKSSKRTMSSTPNLMNPVRFLGDRKAMNTTPIRIRPKAPQHMSIPVMSPYNGYSNQTPYNSFISDNINLSLENLTQGLDMAAVAQMNNNAPEDDVVCTPDFLMEPLCEVTEDNADDDVQCMTPMNIPKISQPPPLVPRNVNNLPDLTADNIIQMTENDVTVNAQTGGLKFRVDPQTLSSNKMYRLPDGRIFAINANPNMPGGYSATIVAVTETGGKSVPKGAMYSAKLSAVPSKNVSPVPKPVRTPISRANAKRNNADKVNRGTETVTRECDLEVPVEWYRYNLIDAVDALEYSLSRLNKLKKDATTVHLRTRTISEMRVLHKTLERLLHTSTSRFNEIRDNLNKGLKQYLAKKAGNTTNNISDDEDDDDVEILPNPAENDDPIFIDENSVDSNANDTNSIDQQEVDLTGARSTSELNDSGDKSMEVLEEDCLKSNDTINDKSSEDNDPASKPEEADPLFGTDTETINENNKTSDKDDETSTEYKESKETDLGNKTDSHELHENNNMSTDEDKQTDKASPSEDSVDDSKNEKDADKQQEGACNFENSKSPITNIKTESPDKPINGSEEVKEEKSEGQNEDEDATSEKSDAIKQERDNVIKDTKNDNSDDKIQDSEMSEEMIETLLKGDDADDGDDTQTMSNTEIIGM